MLLIPCPWCGARNEHEFVNGGAADKLRPADPMQLSDAQWCDYLYTTPNTKGPLRERWWHSAGCQRWFVIERNTATHTIRSPDGTP